MRSYLAITTILFSILSVGASALEKPGGLNRTAVNLEPGKYEVLLSPSYTIAPEGAYLSSEVRYQAGEDLAVGAGFGSGEIGFNFGANGTWFIAPDLASQPAFALMGGLYFNRVEGDNYFVLKVTPIVSKEFKTGWGKVTPYAGVHVSPSFRLTEASNQIALKTSTGLQFTVASMGGSQLWAEFGVGIVNANHEIVTGISYPF